MKQYFVILMILISFDLYSQEKNSLEDIAKESVNIKEKIEDVNIIEESINIIGLSNSEFKKLKEDFLLSFEECEKFSRKFKLKNGKVGYIYIDGYKEKLDANYKKTKLCPVSTKLSDDFFDYCEYPKSEMITMYGYYAHEFFKIGEDKSRNYKQNCRRFY